MPPTQPRATLIEVASLAGTSKTSVSRYFGAERDKLSPALRARIAEASERLGYRPNLMARGLKGSGSRLLGVLVADIRNPFSVALVHGIEEAARGYGYSLIVCNTANDPEQEQRHLALLAAYQIEGLIINAAGQPASQLEAIRQSGIPVVLLDRDLPDAKDAVIGLDNALAIDMALDHLSRQGYRAVLYVSNAPEGASARQERLARFHSRLPHYALHGQSLTDLDPTTLATAIGQLADQASAAPWAVLCANGTATLSVARAFTSQGIAMGPLGLMGIDELEWCELVGPGITTLAQPTDAMGSAAVARLLDRDHAPRHNRHPPRLLTRGSTQLTPAVAIADDLHSSLTGCKS